MRTRRLFLHQHTVGLIFGPLEAEIMDIAWKIGECTVKDIQGRLPQTAAYNTVMTTLKRLVLKRILKRRKVGNRKALFSPRCSEREWQEQAAKAAVERLLATPNVPRELLISAFERAIAGRQGGDLTDVV